MRLDTPSERGRVTGVRTADGPVHADAVVLVAGPWSAELLMSVGAPVPLSYIRHQVVQLRRSLERYPTLPTVADGEIGAAEMFATIYKALGIDPHKDYYVGARPVPLTDPGTKAIGEVLA